MIFRRFSVLNNAAGAAAVFVLCGRPSFILDYLPV